MKRNYPQEGVAILEKYLERGKLALDALQAGKIEKAQRFLRRQTAAFHNFVAVDSMAAGTGVNLSQLPEFKRLAEQIMLLDRKLGEELQGHIAQHREDLIQVHSFRKHLRQYRTIQHPGVGFRQSV